MSTAPGTQVVITDGLAGWQRVTGNWEVDTESGRAILMHRPQGDAFNLILAPGGPYQDADISVSFKPISGREDASAGIVFRYDGGRYYVIRANALEDNFRFYTYDRSRRRIATADVTPPAKGQWHTLRVVAKGNHVQGYLDGQLLLEHRDPSFAAGRVGLWTKADSVTAFRDLVVSTL